MTTDRPTICLSMIVKDEIEVLPRLFESCRELIDYWVICDTGSTDGTQDLIRNALDGIPGELHQREWVNFGVNRSELMRYARGKADYLLILDADTTVEAAGDALVELTADAYLLRHYDGSLQYHTKRLVRGSLDWRYEGAVHEYIVSEQEQSVARLDTVTIRTWSVGAIRKGRWERDRELLEQQLATEPGDARARFYLAQTCRDLGRQTADRALLATAVEHYQHRAEMPGWDEETYVAHYQAGVILAELGEWPRAMEAYIRAWERRPQRLEAVHALTAGLRERNCHQAAHRFSRAAASLKPLPVPDDVLFLTPWVYEWGMLFEYSITAYWVGEYRSSLAACKALLNIQGLPDAYREVTVSNLKHAVRETTREAAAQPRRPRPLQHTGTPTRGLPAAAGPAELRDAQLARRLAAACGMSLADVRLQLLQPGRPVSVGVPALGGASIRIRPGSQDLLALDRACAAGSRLPDPDLDDPQLIVDVGAGIGITAVQLAHAYPAARLVVVEHDPDRLELCAENLRALRDRATLIEAAVAGRDQAVGAPVPEITLRTLLERTAGEAAVDYLKLDVGDRLVAVLGDDRWARRVHAIGVSLSPDAGPEYAVSQLTRLGFDASGTGRWVTGTREPAGTTRRRLRSVRR